MLTLDYTGIRVSGAIHLRRLSELALHVTANAHGWARVTGETDEDALGQLTGPVAGREVNILATDETGAERSLFAGVIHEAELVSMGGWNGFRLELVSGTSYLDQKKRSRSFQAVGNTYSQIAQQIVSAYPGGAAICSVGEETALERPLIQYRETDWEFLRRISSHLGGVVVPEVSRGLPRIWFGFPERSYECKFPEDHYQSGISERYYALGGAAAGYSRADFLYYDVVSSQLCDLGWYTKFKGQSFIISEKYGKLERGELRFKYRLGRPGLGWAARREHDKISGMSLQGEVAGTAGERVKLKLDIDQGRDPGGAYAYPWRPATGNMMYCMPQVGTRVALYFPNMDEKQARATSCVRTNGGSCERMGDPSRRSFVTEHGKELNLYPGELSLKSGEESAVTLSDETGVSFTTSKRIMVVAEGPIQMEAPEVSCSAPVGELQLAKADMESGEVLSSYTQSAQFDAIANGVTAVEGTVTTSYPAIPDSLEVVEDPPFDWGIVGNFLIGVIVTAVCVAACVATAGAAAVVFGCMACGAAVATVAMTQADLKSGRARSPLEALNTVCFGALVGAAVGGTIVLAPYAAEALASQFFPIGLKVAGRFFTSQAAASFAGKGLSALASIFAVFKVNDIDAGSRGDGTNLIRDAFGMDQSTYDELNGLATTASLMLIAIPGLSNPRFWSDMKTGQNTIDDVMAQGDKDIKSALSELTMKKIGLDSKQVINIRTAEQANEEWFNRGYDKPPYVPGTKTYVINAGDTEYVRVFSYKPDGTNNMPGGWIMRASDLEGLTASQLRDLYALPDMPTHICDVVVPANFQLQVGIANRVPEWGSGGGIQFDTMGVRLPMSAFVHSRPIN